LGLGAAIEWAGEKICKEHKLTFHFQESKSRHTVDPDTSAQFFRGTRELLMNIVKHSRANSVSVDVKLSDDEVRVVVADDGVGFDAKALELNGRESGFGLASIKERMTFMGGQLLVESKPGSGTRVTLVSPRRSAAITYGDTL